MVILVLMELVSIIPFLFHVKVSRSFCPSISMSNLIGTSTSGWTDASCSDAGFLSS